MTQDMISRGTLEEALRTLGSEDRKAAIKLVSDTLGASILRDIENFSTQCNKLFEALPKLITRAVENLDVDSDSLTTEECLAYSEKLLEIYSKNIELKRKIVQGKGLFPSTVLSSEESFIIDLMNSLETQEERLAFIEALKQALPQKTIEGEE
jgi:hypothetical protein